MKILSRQAGFLNLPNDNIIKTIAVAISLCLACSLIVSTAATLLKPTQVANKLAYKKRNIVKVAGLLESNSGMTVTQAFEQVISRVVDLRTGEYLDDIDALTFDQLKASKDPAKSVKLSKSQDIAQLSRRSNFANVYMVRADDQIQKIILPIKGYGLWSTMHGFVALQADAKTVAGITFYEHGETPGLGGEIENAGWQQSWVGKEVVDSRGLPVLKLVKGQVNPSSENAIHQVDGLAGATLTSNGVSNLIAFWLGKDGFGPYLERLRAETLGESNNTTRQQQTLALSHMSES